MTVKTPSREHARIDGSIDVDQVRPGDIIFCAGPGPLQDLANRAGEPWRHVGMAIESQDGPSIVEVAGPRFRARPIAEGLGNVTEVAVGRVPATAQRFAEEAAAWCATHIDEEQIYAWDDVILTGFIAVTRRFSVADGAERLDRMVSAAVSDLARSQRQRARRGIDAARSYSCSAFVVAAFLNVGHPIEFDLGRPHSPDQRPSLWELVHAERRPLRSACGSRISTTQGLDVTRALVRGLLAAPTHGIAPSSPLADGQRYRWASPGDIWRSSTVSSRFILQV